MNAKDASVKLGAFGNPFTFTFKSFAFAKSKRLSAVTGYRKLFWRIWRTEPAEYRNGWNDAREHVEATIESMKQSGVGVSHKDKWQQGYRDAADTLGRYLPEKR